MKSAAEYRVLFLLPNGHYHPNEVPNLSFPLGAARLSAQLRKAGYPTTIIDAQAEGLFQVAEREQTNRLGPFVGSSPELMLHRGDEFDTVEAGLPDSQLLDRIREVAPDVILVNLTFSTQAGPCRRQVSLIRQEFQVPIMIGGVAATSYPDTLQEHRDLVFRGKFDHHIVAMIDAVREGEDMSSFDLFRRSLAHLHSNGGEIDVEPMSPDLFPVRRLPLSFYPEAEVTFRNKIEKEGQEEILRKFPYLSVTGEEMLLEGPIYAILLFGRPGRDLTEGLTAHVLTREGCVFNCEGCHIAVESRLGIPNSILTRPIESVVSELTALRKAGYSKVILGDDQALLPKRYLPELTAAVKDMGLEFFTPNGVLVNAIAKSSHDVLQTLIKGGLRSFFLAVESARQEIADQYWDAKVPNVLDNTIAAAEKLRTASEAVGVPVRVQAGFVIGHAGMVPERESLEQIYDTMCFARYLVDMELLEYTVFSLYQPFPGTISYDNLKAWDMITSEHAMTFGVYSIAGEDLYSPRSFEALRLAGWLFANKEEATSERSGLNLEPAGEENPHAHIDHDRKAYHLQRLADRYDGFLEEHSNSLEIEHSRIPRTVRESA